MVSAVGMKTVFETLRVCIARAPKTVTADEKAAATRWLDDARTHLAMTTTLQGKTSFLQLADGPKVQETEDSDRVFADCHLELRNLEDTERCGRCGKLANEHRLHKSNRPRE